MRALIAAIPPRPETARSSSVRPLHLKLTPSLSLIIIFAHLDDTDKGEPQYLLWDAEDCYACGGKDSELCVAGRSCAIKEEVCVSGDNQQVVDLSVGCNFTMPVAFSGTDKHSTVMTSGLEVRHFLPKHESASSLPRLASSQPLTSLSVCLSLCLSCLSLSLRLSG